MRTYLEVLVAGRVQHRVELTAGRARTVAINRAGDAAEGRLVFLLEGDRVAFRNESRLSCVLDGMPVTDARLNEGQAIETGREVFRIMRAAEVDVVEPPAAAEPEPDPRPTDSDRQRQQRRISASHITAAPPSASSSGLFKRMSGIFTTAKAERSRLDDLEQQRDEALRAAGTLALAPGAGTGLPEAAINELLAGRPVTIMPAQLDRTGLQRLREARARFQRIDAECAALRAALQLPREEKPPEPALPSKSKADEERAFQHMDDVGTQDLDGIADSIPAPEKKKPVIRPSRR